MKCPTCDGNKVFNTHINTGIDSSRHQWMTIACSTCMGTGEITDERLGTTPAQLSAIEHGKEQQQ